MCGCDSKGVILWRMPKLAYTNTFVKKRLSWEFWKKNCIFVLYELFLREKGLNPSFIEGMLVYQEKIPHCKRGVAEDLISNDG